MDQGSGGTQIVNKLRAQYSQFLRPWESLRMFQGFRYRYLASSQKTLTEVASQRESFTMELGDLFYSSRRGIDGTGNIGFRLKAYELEVLWAQLSNRFKDAIEDSMNSSSDRSTQEWANELRKRRGRGFKFVDWTGAQNKPKSAAFRASVIVAEFPASRKEEVSAQLESEYGGRFWTIRVIGLDLGFKARSTAIKDPDFVNEYQDFAFRDLNKTG